MAKAQKQNVSQNSQAAVNAKSASAGGTVTPLRPGPTHEQIARRAYEIYAARGYTGGREQEDWAQAERELALGRY